DALIAIPDPDLSHLKMNRLSRWQLTQRLTQQFWSRWNSEYLTRLQQRPKWWAHQPNFEPGLLVLVKDDRLPPLQWQLARIVDVFPGEDAKVRVVSIKTAQGVFKRPITKLCALPLENELED
ncbi:unnamed protein product, partial [Allacma fusca]